MRTREKKEKSCKNCGENIPNRNVYCDNICQGEYSFSKKINEWLGGKNVIRKGGNSVPAWIKRYLIKLSKNKCSRCSWCEINEVTGKIPLEIDHIDGDSLNNNFDNLRVLCPNCHSLTPTYKNIGNRQSTRTYR
jgi:hypothetical protein